MSAGAPVGMHCPGCGRPPGWLVGSSQAMCENTACKILFWDPAKTMDELLDDFATVDLTGLGGS